MALPGMTAAEADKVIAGRPYEDAGELVRRGILPKNKYDTIAVGSRYVYGAAELCSAGQPGDYPQVCCDEVILTADPTNLPTAAKSMGRGQTKVLG
jgi:hypothetical protein